MVFRLGSLHTFPLALQKQAQDPMIPIYLQDIFNFYTADWTMLQRDNREYSRYPRFKRGEASRFEKKTIAPQKFEVDLSGEANFILHSEFLDLFFGFIFLSWCADDSRPALNSVFKEGDSNELQKSEADPRNHEFLKPKSGAPDRVPNPISS